MRIIPEADESETDNHGRSDAAITHAWIELAEVARSPILDREQRSQ